MMLCSESFIILVFFLEPNSGKKCWFHFPRNGLEFLEYLLPQMTPAVQNMELADSQVTKMGSIEAIVNQGCLITEDSYLLLRVLQVFRYRSGLLVCS
jgi:hypothetical protein